ncbi:MAG: hypothetical protein PHP10_03605 [Candidatus Omnitrophica bacterium]|nr:hypothetical protein [Candidatus Omnitrophota bacterium]
MGKSSYRYFSVTLAAGQVLPINVYARYITILSNSIATNPEISIGGDQFETIKAGLSIELPEGDMVQEIQLRNPSAGLMTLTFALSAGKIVDSSLSISGSINIIDMTAAATGSLNVEAAVGAAQAVALAANPSRKSFSIQANPANTGNIYVSYFTGVDATHYKYILQPGQVLNDDQWKGAVYVFGSAAGQNYCPQEETL